MVTRIISNAFLLIATAISVSQVRAADEILPIKVESVVLRLLEEAEVPAQESGVVTSVAVREGQRVNKGELLTQIDDQVPRLAADAAKAQFEIARAKATNDVQIRFAKKSLEVSVAELRRSTESIERFPKSVSQSQLDVEKLNVEKNQLESESDPGRGDAAAHPGPVRWRDRASLRTQGRVGEAGAAGAANRECRSAQSGRIRAGRTSDGRFGRKAGDVDGRAGRQFGAVCGHDRVRQSGDGSDHRAGSRVGRD